MKSLLAMKDGILAAVQHPCEIVDSGVRMEPADSLDECRDDVVVHLAILVVNRHSLLNATCNSLIVNDYVRPVAGEGIDDNLKDVEQFPSVASTVTEHRLGFPYLKILVPQKHIIFQVHVQKSLQIVDFQ